MDKIKVVSRIALFISATSFIFTLISAIATYYLLIIVNSGSAPAEYMGLSVLTTMLPYLFIAALALIVSIMTRGAKAAEEQEANGTQQEALPPGEIEKAFDEDIA